MPQIPRFRVPFAVESGVVQVIEQDSPEEVGQCVETIVRTPVGSLIDAPDFGITDPSFEQLSADMDGEAVLSAIEEFEPRVELLSTSEIEERLLTLRVAYQTESE